MSFPIEKVFWINDNRKLFEREELRNNFFLYLSKECICAVTGQLSVGRIKKNFCVSFLILVSP